MFNVRLMKNKTFKVAKDFLDPIQNALKKGMDDVEKTSRQKYLSGPRPQKVGSITGKLRNSLKTKVFAKGRNRIGEIQASVFYGRFHEDGTKKMRKRPFLEPALDDNIEGIQERLEKYIIAYWDRA